MLRLISVQASSYKTERTYMTDKPVTPPPSRLRANKTNGEKIKIIIDRQVDTLMDKAMKGRALTNVELQTLATCINILKLGFEEINSSVKQKLDLKTMSTEELKSMIGKNDE